MPDNLGLPETLSELPSLTAPDYLYSRSVPDSVKEHIPAGLLGILDWMIHRLLVGQFAVRDLNNLWRAPDSVLQYYIRQLGVPVPTFALPSNLRKLARDAAYINKFKNSVYGWQTYLSDIAPNGVTVVVTHRHKLPNLFRIGLDGRQFSNASQMSLSGTGVDPVNYLLSVELYQQDITVVCQGSGMDEAFKNFVKFSGRYFIPMVAENMFTTISYIFIDT